MEMQAKAERKMRAKVLDSEGRRQSAINIAEGKKLSVTLESEAAKMDQVNRAKGEAEAIITSAQATAKGIQEVSRAIEESGGVDAVSLRIAEQYIEAFDKICKEGTLMLLPGNGGDAASMIVQAAAIYKKVSNKFDESPSSSYR
ncbi:unnamed protein product [Ilex paraguariensis]|uniref:STML2-like C-terminal extension domain-containing protein n=1 Tax=Ilex paraguariensis TaxID=185542 RepID=A0ABC8UZF6_9AQUA